MLSCLNKEIKYLGVNAQNKYAVGMCFSVQISEKMFRPLTASSPSTCFARVSDSNSYKDPIFLTLMILYNFKSSLSN